MTYTSVEQIFGNLDETRAKLYSRVENLSAGLEDARASADAWTVREIVEHLAMIEGRMLQMMTMMLAKGESAQGERPATDAPYVMKPFSLNALIERARREKYTAPEMVRPTGARSIADSLASLRRTREELRALQARIEAVDLSEMKYPHPAFGPLDFYQWLAFIGLHEGRHLRQIEAALAAAA